MRVGFVGAGGIARRHLGVLQQMDDVEVVAVTDADPARAGEFARDAGAALATDVAALLRDERPDALFICVPPFAHGQAERAAVDAGVPFFVEKPVALAIDDAVAVADAADGLVTGVGYHWRYLDGLDRVREVTASRPPRLAAGFWLGDTPPVGWWVRQAQSGGQFVEQLTHVVDLARYLIGETQTVFGLTETTHRPGFEGLDVATSSTATVSFDGGCVGSFSCTCLLGWTHRVELQLFGDGYAIEVTDHDVMVDVGAGRPRFGNDRDPVHTQDRTFLDAAAGGDAQVRCTYRDAVETLRVTLAVAASASTGRAVELGVGR